MYVYATFHITALSYITFSSTVEKVIFLSKLMVYFIT